MAKSFQTSINLNKFELQNARIQNLASAPISPVAGQIYFDTITNKYGIYNGTGWDYMGTSTATGDFSSNTSSSVDGEVVVFSGTGGKTGKRATGSGIAKLASGVLSTATSGTDYAPATTGTSILKASSGGFANAVSGTDYAPATSGSSILKGNGSGGFSSATAGTDYYSPGGTDVAVADGGTGASTLTGVLKGNGTSAITGSATLSDLGAPTGDISIGSHKLTNVTDPTGAQDAATKAYVDATAAGIDWKSSVRAIATTNGTLASAFANGQSIDGVTLATGNRILLAGQTTGADNGIYTVNATGAPTRAADADTSAEMTAGVAVFVEEGTTNADTGWVLTTNGTITLGTTSLTFTQFTGLGTVTAGTGLAKSGNTLSIENSGVLTVSHGGTGAATLTGLLKGNGTSAFSVATAGTDYAPATSGSSLLKGNGSGGFAAAKYSTTVGDGSSTSITVTHNLGTRDVIVSTYLTASTYDEIECDVLHATTTTVTLGFATAPSSGQYSVVVIG